MSAPQFVDGFAAFATLHPLFTFGPALIALLLVAGLVRKRAAPERSRAQGR